MARDSSPYARPALVLALKADAGVTAIVGTGVYGPNPPTEPTWPFVRIGLPSATPKLATGLEGANLALTVHGFVKGPDESGAAALGAAISAALDDRTLTLAAPYSAKLTLSWKQTQTLTDIDEAQGWHVVVSFAGRVTS
jgi:hypothetical protein